MCEVRLESFFRMKTLLVMFASLAMILLVANGMLRHWQTHIMAVIVKLTAVPLPVCTITINSAKDGIGHNLNSLLSLLNAHGRLTVSGKSVLYYDATFLTHLMYIKETTWTFDHFKSGSEENYRSIAYYLEVQRLFALDQKQRPRQYTKCRPALHWIKWLSDEEPCRPDWIYQIGNAFYLTQERYPSLRRLFVEDNKLLPPSRLSSELHSLVVHMRQTDGGYRYNIFQFIKSIGRFLRLMQARHKGQIEVYIHTDGSTQLIRKKIGGLLMWKNINILGKNETSVLQVISDMAYCDTLVGTPASLSHLGSYLSNAKLIFGGGRPNFNMMAPRTQDLDEYINGICEEHWNKCNGKTFFDESDTWVWGDEGN